MSQHPVDGVLERHTFEWKERCSLERFGRCRSKCLDLGEEEIATSMRVTRGTVKSTTSRALTALGRMLGEQA